MAKTQSTNKKFNLYQGVYDMQQIDTLISLNKDDFRESRIISTCQGYYSYMKEILKSKKLSQDLNVLISHAYNLNVCKDKLKEDILFM